MTRCAVGMLCLALVAVLAVAAPAVAQEPPAKRSEGVTYLGTIPEPGVISARFRGRRMYVSSETGLSIYDISAPARPQERGRLPLPNFENEDIDLGRNIALISNDPSEGAGLLHVIDISDPSAPRRITSFNTGTADGGILSRPLLEPTGFGWGTGHTASCVDECRYVYLAGTGSGIDIVDLRDPANPKYAGNFPAAEANGGLVTHDVQFDAAGRALISGAGGVAAYDVSDPLKPRLAYRTDDTAQSRYPQTFGADDGSTVNDYIHHNSMRLRRSDIAGSTGDPASDSAVLAITEEDYNRPTCQGAGSFHTWRIGSDNIARFLDRFDVEVDPTRQTLCSAHYFDVRGGLVAQGWYEQGTRFLDVSRPADIRQVGYWIPNKTLTWGAIFPPTDPAGEIVYSLDNTRGIDVLRFDRPDAGEPPRPTVVAAPGLAPEVGDVTGAVEGGAADALTNVALAVTDGGTKRRAGRKVTYRITLRHLAGTEARDLRVALKLPRGLVTRKRNRVLRVDSLAPGETKTWRVTARIRRHLPKRARVLQTQARLTLADANPRDNRAIDRTAVGRGLAARAAADHVLAQDMALLPAVRAPRDTGRAQQIPATRSAYGWVCRV